MKRTNLQNRSMHKLYANIATALNDAGHSFNDREVLVLDVDFTPENVKEHLWRPVQLALFPEKHSTTELTTSEVSIVYENLNRFLAQRVGIHVPFPSEEDL